MSVGTIARKDFADAGRSRMLWALTVTVVLFTAGITGLIAASTDEPAAMVFGLAFQFAGTVLPIVALFVAKGAVTGERESGSLRMLLSLPPSRSDILVGKLLGRMGLILVATLVGGAATGLVVVTMLGGGLDLLVPFVAFLGLMGMAFVAVGVGISAASGTDGRATAVAVGVYIVFVALWNLIQQALQFAASELGLVGTGGQPAWLEFVSILPPHNAATAAYEATTAGGRLFAADPLASVWLPALVLLVWFVVPVAGGYLRFRKADIG
jgi:ABC-2 type transport system permease protein